QFLDSVPGIRWAYEPVAYADETGQYLPDFEVSGLLDTPLVVEVKGAANPGEVAAVQLTMSRVWSSLPNAAIAVWTGAVIEEGAPFGVSRLGVWLPETYALRTCRGCGHGVMTDGSDSRDILAFVRCPVCLVAIAA